MRVITGEIDYIVVDGYGSACGAYVLNVVQSVTQDVPCPPGATIEGEPTCYDGYGDEFNGGCCCSSYSFPMLKPLPGTLYVCGTGGTFDFEGMDYRDTDWYEINVPEATVISTRVATGCGSAPMSSVAFRAVPTICSRSMGTIPSRRGWRRLGAPGSPPGRH